MSLQMFEIRERPEQVERALLLGVYHGKADEAEARALLAELVELVTTLGIGIVDSVLVRAPQRNARYLVGTGKAAEMMERAKELECDCIIFDNNLTPMQQRAWEADSGLTVIDREEVILDIFARRARTSEARLQVELARMQYALPRMARMWSHLDRQGGGAGGGMGGGGAARGEGEKQIEVDKRLARDRITKVKEELEEVRRIRATQRKEREDKGLPVAAIVGYTNAGKSSLLNRLTGAGVLAENKLFATLDTTTRRFMLPDNQEMLVSDTVGFVRNLPHRLVEAFKATLEEAVLADFLIHVVDASSPEAVTQHKTTLEVLRELGAQDKPVLTVLNKIDLLDETARREVLHAFTDPIPVSVLTGQGMETLVARMHDLLRHRVVRKEYRIPSSRGDLLAKLHAEGKVLALDYDGPDAIVTAIIPKRHAHLFAPFAAGK
jgi:GTP-binding protein HflX